LGHGPGSTWLVWLRTKVGGAPAGRRKDYVVSGPRESGEKRGLKLRLNRPRPSMGYGKISIKVCGSDKPFGTREEKGGGREGGGERQVRGLGPHRFKE